MENAPITIDNNETLIIENFYIKKMVQEGLPILLKDLFSKTYGNPVYTAIDDFFKLNKDGIQKIIKEIMEEIIEDVGSKEEMKNVIIAHILKNNFNNLK